MTAGPYTMYGPFGSISIRGPSTYTTRAPAWKTAHTRQSARASDSGSP
jgi:hypothetical protein